MIVQSTETNVEAEVPLLLDDVADDSTKSSTRGFSFRLPTFELPRFRGSGDVDVKVKKDHVHTFRNEMKLFYW